MNFGADSEFRIFKWHNLKSGANSSQESVKSEILIGSALVVTHDHDALSAFWLPTSGLYKDEILRGIHFSHFRVA